MVPAHCSTGWPPHLCKFHGFLNLFRPHLCRRPSSLNETCCVSVQWVFPWWRPHPEKKRELLSSSEDHFSQNKPDSQDSIRQEWSRRLSREHLTVPSGIRATWSNRKSGQFHVHSISHGRYRGATKIIYLNTRFYVKYDITVGLNKIYIYFT